MRNNGLQNELEIVALLDGKLYRELPEFWQRRINQLDRDVREDDRIECYKCVYNQKADISIRIDNKKWNISIKSGYFVSVHSERISSFSGFLRSLGIEEELIETMKLYHYGDGTTDGTGEVRKSVAELKEELKDRIRVFNEAVNKKEVLSKIVLRFLCIGTPFQRSFVTHIYHGTKDYGELIDAKTMVDYICSGYPQTTTSIHFGPFIYCPAYRGVVDFDSNNVKRYYIEIKWPSLIRDIRDAKEWYFRIHASNNTNDLSQ